MPEATPIYTATTREAIRETCRAAARKYGLDETLFLRQIKQESAFDPNAEDGDCKGLGQISLTFYPLSNHVYWPHGDWRNVEDNVNLAAYIMAGYLKAHDGNWLRALACYNAGPGYVGERLALYPKDWILWMPSNTVYYFDQILGGNVNDN